MSSSDGRDAGPVASGRSIECCPAGCSDTVAERLIVFPECPLRSCQSCGQLVSQITAMAYAGSMKEFDQPSGPLPSVRTQRRHDARAAKLFESVAKLIPSEPRAVVRLLDIGCSSEALLRSALCHGFNVEGVEPAVEPHEAGWVAYRMIKVAAEVLAMPARLFGKGHDMLALFRRCPA